MWPHIWLFLWYISVRHFYQFPSVFDLLWAAIFSQGRSSQWRTGGSGEGICLPGFVTFALSFRKAWLLTCLCYAVYLKAVPSSLPASSTAHRQDCGGGPLLSGDPCSVPQLHTKAKLPPKAVGLKLECTSESSGQLVKIQLLCPTLRVFDSVSMK